MSKKFSTLFQPGDIITSDQFRDGLCMIVVEYIDYDSKCPYYRCEDLFLENQTWAAKERMMYSFQKYNWQLATDDDICKSITKHIRIEEKINYALTLEITEDRLIMNWLGEKSSLEIEEVEGMVKFLKKHSMVMV